VLAHLVRRALEWDSFAPDERIGLTVANGWATLTGCVANQAASADAERAVRQIDEVRGVTNLLEVRATESASDRIAALAFA
jgi:osmotically-inducible protein OsmY